MIPQEPFSLARRIGDTIRGVLGRWGGRNVGAPPRATAPPNPAPPHPIEINDYCLMLSQVVDQLPQHIFARGRDGRFLMVNRAKAAHHGLEPHQMIGLRTSDLPAETLPRGNNDDELDAEVYRTGQPTVEEDVAVQNRNGVLQRRTLQKTPLRDRDGAIVGVICISHDETERWKAESALRDSEERFRVLADAMPYPLTVSREEDGQILFANTATRTLFRMTDAPTRHSTREFYADPTERDSVMARLRTDGSLSNHEGLRKRMDGTTFWAMASSCQMEFDGQAAVVTSVVDLSPQKEAQIQARASERLLRTVFDHVPANLFVKDVGGRYVMANAEFTGMIGCTEADVIGRTWEEVAKEFDVFVKNSVADDTEVLERGQVVDIAENEVRFTDPQPQFRHLIKAPLRDESGEIVGVVGISTDVTRRVLAERALSENQRLLETILDTLPFSVFMRDLDGRYRIVNESFCTGIGLTPDRVIGRHYQECLDDVGLKLDSSVTSDHVEAPLNRGERVEVTSMPARWADGREEYWHYVRTPFLDESGQPAGTVGAIIDVTERVRTERALRERERELELAQDIGGVGTWRRDLETGRLTWSAGNYRVWGFDPAEGTPSFPDLVARVHPEEQALFVAKRREALDSTGRFDDTSRIIWPDGSLHHIRNVGEVVRDSRGMPIAMIGLTQDVTERVVTERTLKESEERFRVIAEHLPFGLSIIDAERGTLRFANRGLYKDFRFSGAPETFDVQAIYADPDDRDKVLNSYRAYGRYGPRETLFRRWDGSTFWAYISGAVIQYDGQPAYLSSWVDISDRKQAEEQAEAANRALRESESRYRNLFEGSVQGVVIHRDRKMLYVNEVYCRMLGYDSAEEVLAIDSLDDIATSAERERLATMAAARLAGEDAPLTYETALHRRDRSVAHLIATSRVIEWQGQPAIQSTIIDISERKRAEDELRASRRLLELVVDTLPLWVFVKDLQSNYLMVNQAMADFFGVPKESLLGLNTANLPAPAATRSKSVEDDQWVYEHLAPLDQPRVVLEHPDGTGVPFHSLKLPLFDDDGHPIGLLAVNRDIRAEERAQADLQASRDLLQTVFDTIPHSLFVKDRDGRYLMVNREQAGKWNLAPEDLLGLRMPFEEESPANERDAILESDHRVLAYGETVRIEINRVLADGRPHTLASIKAPLRDGSNQITGLVGLSEDITERRAAEAERERSQRIVNTILENVPIILWAIDEHGTITLSSGKGLSAQSLSEADIIGQNVFDLYAESPSFLRAIRSSLNGQPVVSIDMTRGRTFERWMQPQYDSQGAVSGLLGISLDVTDREQSRKALTDTQELLNYTVNNSPTVLYALDTEGRVTLAEGQGLRRLNTEPGAQVGLRMADVLGHQPEIVKMHLDALHKQAVIDTTVRLGGRDWKVYVAPRRDPEDHIIGSIGMAFDVTEQIQANLRLEESERRFRSLFEGSLQGVLIHDRGRPVLANQAWCDLIGYDDPDQFYQVDNIFQFIPEEDQGLLRSRLEDRLAGNPVPQTDEVRFLHRDGSLRHGLYYNSNVEFEGRQMVQIVLMDITDRKRFEEELAASQSLMETVIDTLPHWIHVKDANLRYTLVNRTFTDYTQFPREYLLGRTGAEVAAEMGGDVRRPSREEDDRRVLQTGQPLHKQASPIVDAQGNRQLMDVIKLPLLNSKGQCTAVVTIIENVTERVETIAELERFRTHLEELVQERTEQLREAQAELVTKERLATLGLLTGVVSHELRNPLGTIRTSFFFVAEMARDAGLGVDDALARIDRNIDRCDRIIEELLSYTRPPMKDPTPVEIDDLVREVLGETRIPAGITVTTDLDAPGIVRVDRERIRRALINVVQNAVQAITDQAGRDDGVVQVQTQVTADRLEISIHDDGPGIADDVRDRLFEPLFSTKGFGVGLGLPIVKQILEAHQGGVELRSDEQAGTTFILWLPKPDSAAGPPPA